MDKAVVDLGKDALNDWGGRGCHSFFPGLEGIARKLPLAGKYLTNPLVK